MIDPDFKLIDSAVNNKLNSEELSEFNQKMKDKGFRNTYLNYLLDETMLSRKLATIKESEESLNPDQDLSSIYDALNNNLGNEDLEVFNESMKDSKFRDDYLDFILDEKLLERTLEKQRLASAQTRSKRLKVISSAVLAIAASIIIFLSVSIEKGIAKVDRVFQASLIKDGKEIQIGKNTKLKAGDRIKVKGSLTIVYPDKTEVVVNKNSEIILGGFSESINSRFELIKGYLTVNALENSRTTEIITKESRTVFADSTFTLSMINNLSTVEVHRGEVDFYNNFGSNDIVIAGQQAWVKDDLKVSARKVYIDNEDRKFTF